MTDLNHSPSFLLKMVPVNEHFSILGTQLRGVVSEPLLVPFSRVLTVLMITEATWLHDLCYDLFVCISATSSQWFLGEFVPSCSVFFNLDSFTNSEEPLGATREPSSSVSDQSLMFQRLELDFFLFLYLSVYSFIILFISVSCSFFLSLE